MAIELAQNRLHLGGIDFEYLEAGRDNTPTVLCLHGFPDYPRGFESLLQALAGAGFRAVAPWLRGYWPSTLGGPFNLERLVEDVSLLIQVFGRGKPVHLVGHDWGAAIAYWTADLHPGSLGRMVTMSVPYPAQLIRNGLRDWRQLIRSRYMGFFQIPWLSEWWTSRADLRQIDALWERWSPGFRMEPVYREELHRCLANSMPAPLQYYRDFMRPTARNWGQMWAVARGRRRISVPTLYLHGADDGCVAPTCAEGMESLFGESFERVIIPGAGHFLQQESPASVNAHVLRWLTT